MHVDEKFFELLESINRAPDQASILKQMQGVAADNGYNHFIISGLPPRGVGVEAFVLAAHWPDSWYSRYFERDYTQFDPVARNCFQTILPFYWSEAPFDRSDDLMARRVMNEAEDCGLKAGFCVPIHTQDGMQGCVSFGGDTLDLDPNSRNAIHLVSTYAFARLRALRRPARLDMPKLTGREVEVLKWMSHGKSSEDIADLLGLSHRTVEFHYNNASRKLGTMNRTHAVAEALRYNLIPL
ncbi:MAG: LuxR family transcriptional regulator [Devosia sp.]